MSIEDQLSFYALAVAVPVTLTTLHSYFTKDPGSLFLEAGVEHPNVATTYVIEFLPAGN